MACSGYTELTQMSVSGPLHSVAHTDRGEAAFCCKVEFANANHQAVS